jgi:hypothetical protein
MIRFFLSIKTTLWLLLIQIALLFAGAIIMPTSTEFQTIHSMPFFEWLKTQRIGVTWWLWASIFILSILTLNTIFCSIESIIKKTKLQRLILLLSPQIIHIGFLFILLAHLLSSNSGFIGMAVATEGTLLRIPDSKVALHINTIIILADKDGYLRDWQVNIEYIKDNQIHRDIIRPNAPSLKEGFNVNVRDLQFYPEKAVLLQVSKEPGALWALIGGILFILGTVTLIVLKIKSESSNETD